MRRPEGAAPQPHPGKWLRTGSVPPKLLQWAALMLVAGIVVGALAVRLLGGDRTELPSLYPDLDSARPFGAGRPGDEPAPAVDLGAPDTLLDLSLFGESPNRSESGGASGEAWPYVPPTPVGGWADADERSPRTRAPLPDSLRVPKPDAVRGVYLGSWSAGSRRRMTSLLELADDTEINTFVIDVKDVTGEASYETEVPLAVQMESSRRIRIPDVEALLDSLRAHGIYAIARIVVFKDPLLATVRPEWSVVRDDGSLWVDHNGVRWVDSFNRNVWDYNIELAREAVALGFDEIQWDYVRFPDVPASYRRDAIYPAQGGRTRIDAIREFLGYARDRLAELEVPVTADVFGITTSAERDVGIGQDWDEMARHVDVILPMVYPSHYPSGVWGYANPNAAPYQVVKHALDDAVDRSRAIPASARIRPWLQAFTLGKPVYGARQIRAQIDAVYDAGLDEWLLWHSRVRYPAEALVDADGVAPWFAGMGETLYPPDGAEEPREDGGRPR